MVISLVKTSGLESVWLYYDNSTPGSSSIIKTGYFPVNFKQFSAM